MPLSPPAPHLPAWRRAYLWALQWQPQQHPLWMRLLVVVLVTLLAAWARMALAPAESGGRFITLSLAAALSALYGGFTAGMFSTVLGMLVVNFFLIPPYGSFAFSNPVEAFWLNLWHFVTQLVVVGAIWAMQRQNQRLREAYGLAQRSQQTFFDTFEHAAAGMTHVDIRGRFLRVNASFCRMLGYSAGELLSMSFQELTDPDDVGPDERFLREALDGKRNSYTMEKRYRHKDGHTVWAHLTVALMRRPDGNPDYFISVIHDITSRKVAEEAVRTNERLMRQAQALAGFASWEADVAGNHFRTIGNSYQRLLLPGPEFTGEDLMAMTHPKDRERLQREWVEALQGVREYNTSYRVRIRGEDRWYGVRAEFERDENGRAVRAFGVTQDITERKRFEYEIRRLNASLEQRIQERTRELKAAYDELESYSYAVAHDLRSPLRIINGFALALAEDNDRLDATDRRHLDRIMGASKKMGQLIDGLLQLAQYGRGEVVRQPLDLSAMAQRQLEELSAQHPERRVQWSVEPGLYAHADPALIEALLQNLLHNAWKYTAQTTDAQIRFYEQDIDGQVHFSVSDNGAGFDMSRAQKLFQPFQRLHLPHEFAGLGIGLATAQRIVQRHGGQLRAEAAPGRGATFSFSLPEPDASDSVPSHPPV